MSRGESRTIHPSIQTACNKQLPKNVYDTALVTVHHNVLMDMFAFSSYLRYFPLLIRDVYITNIDIDPLLVDYLQCKHMMEINILPVKHLSCTYYRAVAAHFLQEQFIDLIIACWRKNQIDAHSRRCGCLYRGDRVWLSHFLHY